MKIRMAGVANDSIVDGEGIRFTLFVQGCPHNCEGCHNPQTHDFNSGYIDDTDKILEQIKQNPLLDGVTFSGGEPFCQAEALSYLGKQLKGLGYDIVTYTGYTLEYLLEHGNKENKWLDLLKVSDFLVDGRFELDKKRWDLRFRGSSNQRYLDCKESLKQGKAIEFLFA